MITKTQSNIANMLRKAGRKVTVIDATKIKSKKAVPSRCFRCDGGGQICNTCGESESACRCDPPDLGECPDCKGTGK